MGKHFETPTKFKNSDIVFETWTFYEISEHFSNLRTNYENMTFINMWQIFKMRTFYKFSECFFEIVNKFLKWEYFLKIHEQFSKHEDFLNCEN